MLCHIPMLFCTASLVALKYTTLLTVVVPSQENQENQRKYYYCVIVAKVMSATAVPNTCIASHATTCLSIVNSNTPDSTDNKVEKSATRK